MCARFAEDQHETGDENQNIVRGSDPYLSEDEDDPRKYRAHVPRAPVEQSAEPTRKYNNGEWLWLKKSWTGLFMEMRVYVTNAQLSNNVWTYQLQDERGAAPPDRNGERTLVPERYLKRNN